MAGNANRVMSLNGAPQRPRRADQTGNAPRTMSTLEARIEASAAGAARLLKALHSGCKTFVITALGGQMSARVQITIVNAAAAETEYRLGSGRVTVDWSRATVANGAKRVSLSRTELRLLAAIVGGEGKALSRASLIEKVWRGGDFPDVDRDNELGVYVCALRKRLALAGAGDAIQTVRGLGYRARM